MNRKFTGVWIPARIWLNEELTITEKCLLAEINSLDNNEDRGCFASNEYLGKFLGISAGSTANMVSKLKRKGLIVQIFFDGRNRGLRVPILHEEINNLHTDMNSDFTQTGKQPSHRYEHIIKKENKDYNKEEKETFSYEKEAPKKTKAKKPSRRASPPGDQAPNMIYTLYAQYATFFESRAGAQAFPRTGAGHLVLDAKDARALKDFVKYFGEVHPGSAEEAWGDFLEAAWQAGDKWIRDNFCPHILWGQKNRLFTRAAKATAPRIQATDEEAEAVLRAMEELGR